MSGFCILMLIIGLVIFIIGLYMFTGHELELISWIPSYDNLNKERWIYIGKWTMIASIIPFILALIGIII